MAMQPQYQPGEIVPFRLTPSIVAASFFVSLTGAITTVELLQRRTHARGWYSVFELLSCSVSFGLVAIWCMHFVGNRAIVMGDGDPSIQLYYNSGFTFLSVLLPILALFAAFTIADRRHRGTKQLFASLVASGIVAGLAISGMHYTGQCGVPNYSISYDPKYIGGSILIASAACVLALTMIFMLQDRWISILPYRLMASVVLAGAVCSMHFEATMGTQYRFKYLKTDDTGSRNTNVIIATVLSLLTIPVCFAIAFSTTRRQKQLADRAQQVILACARFDFEGRVMVTVEGLLPCQSVTVHENQRCFEDEFNVTHPAFQWIFQVSNNWTSIARWVPKMRRHLRAINFLDDSAKRLDMNDSTSVLDLDLSKESEDYSLIFRESFCVAASDLANDFKESLSDIGTLYDGVMMTGTLAAGGPHRRKSMLGRFGTPSSLVKDIEANIGVDVFGKGQLLFLVQQCDARDVVRLNAQGYRFVSIDKVQGHLARSMQVPSFYLDAQLKNLQEYARDQKHTDVLTGTHLGCFVLKAGLSRRSWEVVVLKDLPYRIPSVELSPVALDPALLGILSQLDGLPVSNCLTRLVAKVENPDEPYLEFWKLFKVKIKDLETQINEPFFRNAIFSSKIIRVPTWNEARNCASNANLIAFHIIPDVHLTSLKSSPHLMYTPFSFLRCRQEVLEGSHRASFDRRIHCEFASLFAKKQPSAVNRLPLDRRHSSISKPKAPFSDVVPLNWFSGHLSFKTASKVASLRSLTSRAHPGSADQEEIAMQANMPFGGIMVSSDVTVETGPKNPDERVVEFTMDNAGTSAYAGGADAETVTYLDELYTTAVAKWQRT